MNVYIRCFRNSAQAGREAADRLNALGHRAVPDIEDSPAGFSMVRLALRVEEAKLRLKSDDPPTVTPAPDFRPDLVVDLTGKISRQGVPVLSIEVNGTADSYRALASIRTNGRQADVVARLDGVPVAHARPMISAQVFILHNLDELFAALQSLIVHSVLRLAEGRLTRITPSRVKASSGCFPCAYVGGVAGAVARRLGRTLRPEQRPFYWRTAWRFIDGPGVADAMRMEGSPFAVLPDDGERFYADPFPFEHEGRHYIFVEEYPYGRDKGIISVAEVGKDGLISTPRPVLEESHHLSYPLVLRSGGEIFMLPESSVANELVLYRAKAFPDRWVRHAVLIEGRSINDATVIEHKGRHWMFATEKFGSGSASDTMVVFSAARIDGPWTPHRLNPILIDRAGARPGGNIIRKEGRLFLPVQDGTRSYGGGLGLREIVRLDDEDVVLGPVVPIAPGSAWGGSIHTLNRAGRLEVIDSAE